MNKVKRTARKRFIRQEVNELKLTALELDFELPSKPKGRLHKDNEFFWEIMATQKPYTVMTPFRARTQARMRELLVLR